MPPTPYTLPAGYQVLAGNHVSPVVDARGNTFWGLNVKRAGSLLYFAVFLQPPAGQAKEVLAISQIAEGKEVGQGGLSVCPDGLYATAFRSPSDAVSPPFVQQVPEYIALAVVDQTARDQASAAKQLAQSTLSRLTMMKDAVRGAGELLRQAAELFKQA